MREIIDKLCDHQTITKEEAKSALLEITKGECDSHLVASFLTIFRMRSVTVEELLGFREAMLSLAIKPKLNTDKFIDVCGTGGDGKNSFNISTLSSFIIAGSGVKVAKHGNVGVSSTCGSSDVLVELGVKFSNEDKVLNELLDKSNICYLHAPLFHPAMKNVSPIRKILKVRTIFNLLGPLVNPCQPYKQVVGVFALEIAKLFKYSLAEILEDFRVLHSLDIYDEVSLTSDWYVFGKNFETRKSCSEFGLTNISPKAIEGGSTKEESAKILIDILSGKGSKEQNDVVCFNAAYGIEIGNDNMAFKEALDLARDTLGSGKALDTFNKFKEISRSY